MNADGVRIEKLDDPEDDEVRAMLVDLTLGEQVHYAHPQESRDDLVHRLHIRRTFAGENHVLVARDDRTTLGFCWVALFDPGTGLEAEVAELYVRPEGRGRGVASSLAAAAMAYIKSRHVTFASVWTRADNPAAIAAYRAAGFTPTEQTVLTWLPL